MEDLRLKARELRRVRLDSLPSINTRVRERETELLKRLAWHVGVNFESKGTKTCHIFICKIVLCKICVNIVHRDKGRRCTYLRSSLHG